MDTAGQISSGPLGKKVIELIEADEVETLIVKDMSRLGREYLQVGQLTELYLPTKGVRFIAITTTEWTP